LPGERKPILCYVTDRRALQAAPPTTQFESGDPAPLRANALHDCIRRAVACGISWIQIREKDLDTGALLEMVRRAVRETHGTSSRVLVNERLDVALAAKAGGIHLGEQSLPLKCVVEWRSSAGRLDFLIGVSCHSLESARAAELGGADYIFFGPVYATPSKAAYGAPQGIERLREVCASVKIPVLAIGGVNWENARECLAAGASGIAAIRLFQDGADTAELAAQIERFRLHK
jgi:thiamine-phosphate pyrophosphorylase